MPLNGTCLCNEGNLCPSGMGVRLLDGTGFQSDQILTQTITTKGSKRLTVVDKLHQAHLLCSAVASAVVMLPALRLDLTVPAWTECQPASRRRWCQSSTRTLSSKHLALAGLRSRRQGWGPGQTGSCSKPKPNTQVKAVGQRMICDELCL